MNNNKLTPDSKEYNSKTKSHFAIRITLSLIIGIILGGFVSATILELQKTNSLSQTFKHLANYLNTFRIQILPFVLLTILLVYIMDCFPKLKRYKIAIQSWDGEDDDYINNIDAKLNVIMILSNSFLIFSQIAFALASYGLFSYLTKSPKYIAFVFLTIAVYFAVLAVCVITQSKVVALIKMYAPEKKGSIYDKNFSKVWLQSCDEAEKMMIGQAAYKAFQTTGQLFSIFLTVSIILSMFTKTGILCSIFIGVLWLSMSLSYSMEAHKLEHSNN